MFVFVVLRSLFHYAFYIIFFYWLTLASYRLLLNPLRNYPGPFWAKITQVYTGYYSVRKRLHIEMYQYHAKYDRLVFNTATALKDIYQNDGVAKASTYLVTTRNNVFNGLTALDNAVHSHKRRIIGQAVSDRALRAFEPAIHLAAQASSPVDMTELSRRLAIDVIGQLSFGYDLNMQTSDENRFMMKALTFGNYRGNIYAHLPSLSKLYVDKIGDNLFYEAREKYFRLLYKMTTSRTNQEKDAKQDFYSFVADSFKDTGRGGDLWIEAIFFVVAGGDSAATAMASVFFYLSRYPECYDRLASEIRGAFPSGEDIRTGPQLSGCVYLRACVDEAMRMSPPTPTTLWREQQVRDATEPLVVDGHVIPPGVLVGVNTYALHHNEAYFPEPFTYRPERWLVEEGSGEKKKTSLAHNPAFAPFSVGARACAGKSLAYMEISLLTAKVLWYFDFKPAPGDLGKVGGGTAGRTDGRGRENEFQLDDIFTSRTLGPHLVFSLRGDSWEET
ncbi:cytochrome P450 [Xylariaceae sp. FL0594]|nr:cytochrome P450 [Xylariaceae sp. FL0594]